MWIKILNTVLICFAAFMGVKQGLAILQNAPQMAELFSKWGLSRTIVIAIGSATLISGILIPIPQTFLLGNWLMASVILLLMCLHLAHADLKGFLVETPFLTLNLFIIYLDYPITNTLK